MKFISVAYFFGSEYICLFVRICCVCCVLSVPPAVKPIGIQRQESAREREREGGRPHRGRMEREQEDRFHYLPVAEELNHTHRTERSYSHRLDPLCRGSVTYKPSSTLERLTACTENGPFSDSFFFFFFSSSNHKCSGRAVKYKQVQNMQICSMNAHCIRPTSFYVEGPDGQQHIGGLLVK